MGQVLSNKSRTYKKQKAASNEAAFLYNVSY
jgi:hypothetical protein